MILDISKSKLFTIDPDVRFSKEYELPSGTWLEMWRRYKLLGYSNGDMRDFLFIKHARNLSFMSMQRWIIKGEIYSVTYPLIKKGVVHVNSSIFGDYEEIVMNELTKSLKLGDSTHPKVII